MPGTLASGTSVSIGFTRERVCGVIPAGLSTAVTGCDVTATGTDIFLIDRGGSGSWITDGFATGQLITISSSSQATANANWIIQSVDSADQMTIEDIGDAMTTSTVDNTASVIITMETLRATSRSINPERATLESEEVRTSRQKADVRHGFEQVNGDPGFEWSRVSYNEIMQGAFANQWHTVPLTTLGNVGAALGAAGFGLIDRQTGSWITDGVRPGMVIRATLFADSATNADWIVTGVTALILTVSDPDDLIIAETANATPTVTVPGRILDIGQTLTTYFMERQFADVVQFQGFKGCTINGVSQSVQPESIINGSITILGVAPVAMSSSSSATNAFVAAATTSPYAAFDGAILEGGSVISVVTGLDWDLTNSRTVNPVIGSKNSPAVFEGQCIITGTLSAYFENATLYNKFINETASTVFVKLDDKNGADFMVVAFPNMTYLGAPMDPPAEGPITLEMPFQALESTVVKPAGATIATSMFIQRSDA